MGRDQRILAYDALRVFAILTVVAIHTLMPYRIFAPETAPVRVFDDLLHYAVPLFVFISGVFAWGRPLPDEPGSFRRFLARRGKVILIPFLAWSALYFGLLVWREGWPGVLGALGLLVTGHTWYHLYFVPMLLTFYLLTPLASAVFKRSPLALVIGCYAIRIVLGAALIALGAKVAGKLGAAYATHIVTHLPHMALGAWFAARYDAVPPQVRRLWWLMLLLGTAVLTAASLGIHEQLPVVMRRFVYPLGMAATVLGMAFGARSHEAALRSNERAHRLVLASAPLAFGVYFVHPLLLMAFFEAVPARQDSLWTQPWFALAVFATVSAASFGISAWMARMPVACRLIGLERQQRAG